MGMKHIVNGISWENMPGKVHFTYMKTNGNESSGKEKEIKKGITG
jgi:hypothetical protein